MKQNINSKPVPKYLVSSVSGCTGHFLTEAINLVLVYKTPQKIIEYVEKHKNDYLIQNPPYNDNKNL
jgi:hypothetical protein